MSYPQLKSSHRQQPNFSTLPSLDRWVMPTCTASIVSATSGYMPMGWPSSGPLKTSVSYPDDSLQTIPHEPLKIPSYDSLWAMFVAWLFPRRLL
jgi:hypothetical protein